MPGRDVVNNGGWGLAPSLAFGFERPHPLHAELAARVAGQRAGLRAAVGHEHGPDHWRGVSDRRVRGDTSRRSEQFLRPRETTTSSDIRSDMGDRARRSRPRARVSRCSNTTRYGETHRNSAITAPRPPNRQLQRRDMRNEAFFNQTNLGGAMTTGRIRHGLAVGVEVGREVTATENSSQTVNQPQTTLRFPNPSERPLDAMPALSGNPSRSVTRHGWRLCVRHRRHLVRDCKSPRACAGIGQRWTSRRRPAQRVT